MQLMPTPLIHELHGAAAFKATTAKHGVSETEMFYATNRPANATSGKRKYSNGIEDRLSLGVSKISFGKRALSWDEIIHISTGSERKEQVRLNLDGSHELNNIPGSSGSAFAKRINEKLATCAHPDILIYVHGANSTFKRSILQGAQFNYFMGGSSALLAYSWPSTGSLLTYKKDVEYAAQSAPMLADLIEYLAENTNAKNINILAYSAGGHVTAPGLSQLRNRYPNQSVAALRKRFRLGEIYFAASDIGTKKFVTEYLPAFVNMVDNVTVTYTSADSVLKMSQRSNKGEGRIGRPVDGLLAADEIASLKHLAESKKLTLIDMDYSPTPRPLDFTEHGAWYLNSWVSSDAILQFLFQQSPEVRGLKKTSYFEAYYFPADYPESLKEILAGKRGNWE